MSSLPLSSLLKSYTEAEKFRELEKFKKLYYRALQGKLIPVLRFKFLMKTACAI